MQINGNNNTRNILVYTPQLINNTYKASLAQGEVGAGVSGAKAISIAVTGPSRSSVDSRASAVALREHPREVHTAATRSSPAWRTDHIMNTHMYGHGDGHEKGMFSLKEKLEVIRTSGNGSSGHRDLKVEGSKSGSRDADGIQIGVVGVGGRCIVEKQIDVVGVRG